MRNMISTNEDTRYGGCNMQESHVVTCFLEHDNKILILQRSAKVGSYTECWAGISGYIEPGVDALDQAWQEINEEASLGQEQLELVKVGDTLEIPDDSLGKKWVVHPFRFRVQNPELIKIDWEHNQFKWIEPEEIRDHVTVPGLYTAWERVQ